MWGDAKRLLRAAFDADETTVHKLLQRRTKPDVTNKHGETPLMFAAMRGHAQIASLLLNAGANVNRYTTEGETALFYAARAGHIDLMKSLIQRGADINHRNRDGFTALLITVRDVSSGSDIENVIKTLLDAGADPSCRTHRGQTALDWALATKSTKVAELLQSAFRTPSGWSRDELLALQPPETITFFPEEASRYSIKTYAVVIVCGNAKVQRYFDSIVAYAQCPDTIKSFKLIRLFGKLICYFDDLPDTWTDDGFFDKFKSWLEKAGIPPNEEMEFYGPRMHGIAGYWPRLRIQEVKKIMKSGPSTA